MKSQLEVIADAIQSSAEGIEGTAAVWRQCAEAVRAGTMPKGPEAERVVHLVEAITLATGQTADLMLRAFSYLSQLMTLAQQPTD